MVGIQQEFGLRSDIIYLNHAGTSPWPRRTADAVRRFARENVVQGAVDYPSWVAIETALRVQLRDVLNAKSIDDIALLKNTSEALSVVAYGLPWHPGDNVVTTDQEFPSNRIPWESLAPLGVELREVSVTGPDVEEALLDAVDKRTRLLTVSSVQYATGLRMDLERIGDFCARHGVLFCVDAIQSLGALCMDVQTVRADFAMADGHKWMLGPEGLAVFYTRAEARDRLRLTQYGWHMVERHGEFERRDWQAAAGARRFECGSPNMLGAHALHASLSLLLEVGLDEVERYVLEHAAYLMERIRADPDLELVTPQAAGRHGGIVTFRSRHCPPDALFHHLQTRGVVCAQRAGGTRFSPHFYTTDEQLDQALGYTRDFISAYPR